MCFRLAARSLLALLACGVVACGQDASGVASGKGSHAPADATDAPDDASPLDATADGADGSDGGDATLADAPAEAAVDHSDLLPPGVTPPALWFWRGINQNNLGNWRTDASGRRCADGDTTMWFRSPGNSACQGAPSCDPDHFGTPTAPCTGVDCSWRNWDDPRGPEFRVDNATGPVEVHNWGAKSAAGGTVPDYGFEVTVCAAPGTVAEIDTCPRFDLYSCVEDNYPQFVDQCTSVLLSIDPPPASTPSTAGCYSTKSSVTITF
jgi:hypothetical protein